MNNAFVKGAAALLILSASILPAQSQDLTPVGKWQTTSGESRYEITACGKEALCAKLTWLRADARTEENLAYLGKYVLKGARATSSNKWHGTVQYGGESISGSLTLVDEDRIKLNGCQLIMCKTLEFQRI